ncbi:MAG: hypothetical protein ACLTW9_06335 [Enterocloster sp.]
MRMENLHRLWAFTAPSVPSYGTVRHPAISFAAFIRPIWMFLACAVPIAMIMTIISIFVITKVQKETPNENLGKVMAIITAVSRTRLPGPIGLRIYLPDLPGKDLPSCPFSPALPWR